MSNPTGSVHVIEFARSKDQPHGWPRPRRAVRRGASTCPSPSCWRGAATRIVLVDTGFMREGGGEAMSVKFGIPYWISPVRMLGGARRRGRTTSPTSCSAMPISTIWARSASSRRRASTSRSARSCRWIEAMALPPQFGYPHRDHQSRRPAPAFDASVEHRLDLRRRRHGQYPARHPCAARQGPHDGPAIRHRRDRRAAGIVDLGRLHLRRAATSAATTMTASMPRSTNARRQRLGPAQDDRPHQQGDRRRPRPADHPARHGPLEGPARRHGDRGLQDRQSVLILRFPPSRIGGRNLREPSAGAPAVVSFLTKFPTAASWRVGSRRQKRNRCARYHWTC